MDPVTQGQLALAQNMAAVVTGNNQVISQEKDLTGQAMRLFMSEVRGIINTQATQITALNGRIVQLETDKKDMETAHKTEIAALNSVITWDRQNLLIMIGELHAKNNELQQRFNNHKHNTITNGHNNWTSSAKEWEDIVAAYYARRK